MAQEQFIERGITVLNAVGDRAVDAGSRFGSTVTEEPTKTVILCALLLGAAGGAVFLSALRGEGSTNQNEAANKKPKG